MLIHHILILALVQGITEFLPISSSGHLVLTSQVLGWPDQGLIIDIAVHVGTLFAVMLYFWRDMIRIGIGCGQVAMLRPGAEGRLALNLIIATIPVVIVGFLAKSYIETYLRSAEVIAWTTLGFGVLLWLVDRLGLTIRRIEHLGVFNALFIGMAQVLALVPGTSRAGVTITAARLLGMERSEAARFSMLMSIPTILGAGLLIGLDLYESGDVALRTDVFLAVGLSFVTALVAIWGLMTWLRRSSFTPFVMYRMLLAAGLFYWIYG
ncbi:MAG: undecaprenyl-diphosphate phosphatase [Rhodospirillaceae bacterium]|jgi:undecaprenyl-diphosphatase|nr:undecaprenyl-diphosphate phosphatase [Rhodospirillaceae bacterium]MBT5664081.1 undecaprenyl-diphosphate phosphatase [Rhodospirillaceae bacterium]